MEKVKLYFDPRCPWCYQTSRFLRRLEALKEIDLDYGLYSLEIANLEPGDDPLAIGDTARSAMALRVCAAIREQEDSYAMGRFYKALGDRVWETADPAQDREAMVRECVRELGFPESLVDEAMADSSTWVTVVEEHRELVRHKGGLGVPTLILDGGAGQAFFGPVIWKVPEDSEAVELWQRVQWFARNDNLFELKLPRWRHPDLPGWNVPKSRLTFGTHPWLPPEPDDPLDETVSADACEIRPAPAARSEGA